MQPVLLLLFLPVLAISAEITGSWHLTLMGFGEESSHTRVEFKSEGTRITGIAAPGTFLEVTYEGTLNNDEVRLTATPTRRRRGSIRLEGRIDGDQMNGTGEQNGEKFTWKARRLMPAQGPPRTHTFEPVRFHRVFSGAVEPALRIQPGDTVRTWTVDASGVDANGVRRSLPGNPQTGPFYVEGAMPGDTIAVKFHRIRLNRNSARSGVWLSPNTVTPLYVRDTKYEDTFNGEWVLDRETGYARLAKPTERLKNLRVQLNPMLGCVAVAPPEKQSFGTSWPGSFGGNMDYNGLREGVTVYLPVAVPGALLFVGDGHAVQGDGELNGDALETSMDLEFSVNLIQGYATARPRMENEEWLMASGIANSLTEALQQATTALARWLQRDYRLNANEAAILLGTSIHYEIAEVVDPMVHIVAKVKKEVLAKLSE
jgi:amidase